MALKILLADPDSSWLGTAKKFFQESYYEVDTVSNGKDAQLALFNNKYFAIVLNYDLKNHSGMQVLKFIRSNHPSIKIAFLMNQDYIEEGFIEKETLERLGANDFLIAPFELDEIKVVLEGHQSLGQIMSSIPKRDGVSDEEEVSKEDNQFTKISIHEFFPTKTILFDVYIRLSSGKYLKILHAGDSFSKDRLDKYKEEKKVEFLFFLASDRNKYVRFQNHITKKMVENPKATGNMKMQLLKSASEKFIEDAFCEGVKPLVIEQAKQICDTTYEVIQNSPDLFKVLKEFQDFDPNAYTHSFLTTFFASMIVKQFEWESKVTTETVAMACMFHDIGRMKLPEEIRTLKRWKMTEEQLQEFEKHPEYSFEIVDQNSMISPSVKQIILQHHEASDGSGYPNGLRDSKILTLSKIVFLANEFVDYITEKQLSPPEGLRLMLSEEGATKKFNAIILENFLRVFVNPRVLEKEDSAYDKKNALSNKNSANAGKKAS